MKRTSWIVLGISIAGVLLVSIWAYQKFFKQSQAGLLTFAVTRGSIEQTVKARGEIVQEKNFDLEFPISGTVERVYVREGEQVKEGTPLMKLVTSDLQLELQKLREELTQARSELSIRKSEASNTRTTLGTVTEQQDTLVANAYSTLLSSGLVAEPDVPTESLSAPLMSGRYLGAEGTYRFRVDKKNVTDINYVLYAFGLERADATPIEKTTPVPLGTRGLFISFPGGIDPYYDTTWTVTIPNKKSAVYVSNLSAYQDALRERERAITEAKASLGTNVNAPSIADARITQAEAQVQNIASQIALVEDRIRKSTLYAPTDTTVTKVWLEKSELATEIKTAITLGTPGYKIRSDISELDIVHIRETDGNMVTITLDAFPDTTLTGRVLSVEPQKIEKEGDTYYRTNVSLPKNNLQMRPGMSADLSILVTQKTAVLKVPELAITSEGEKRYVNVLDGRKQTKTEITTGISEGEFAEVLSGLSEGQTVVISAE